MADILIRDVPDDLVAAIDARARRVGISRVEYIRRALGRERDTGPRDTMVQDLAVLTERLGDLADPDVMRNAWS
jgi:hypothetical protein